MTCSKKLNHVVCRPSVLLLMLLYAHELSVREQAHRVDTGSGKLLSRYTDCDGLHMRRRLFELRGYLIPKG